MRTALRTSIVTAALAGALLAPAATALAAPAPQAVTSVSAVSAASAVSASSTGNDRYDGETVLVRPGKIAVLRNKSEGPEAWIRAVSADWKPGDGWAGRVLAKLDVAHPRAVVEGVRYDLKPIEDGPDAGRYVLNVYVLGEGALDGWYLLPKGEPAAKPTTTPSVKPSTKPSVKPSAKPTAKPAVQQAVAPAAAAKPQTAVVPKGSVAAGAEIAPEDEDYSAAVGAGLVAILAGLGTALTLRARKARARA